MRVLLVGEYSNVHNNLKSGLQQLGVDVDTANFGGTYQRFKSDIKLLRIEPEKKYDLMRKYYSRYLYKKMVKYDVVQFINEKELGVSEGFQPGLGDGIARDAKLSVLLMAGCNYQYCMYGKKVLHMSPCDACQKYDLKISRGCPNVYDNRIRKETYAMQKNVDVMVPMAYEYYLCNKDTQFSYKLSEPMPMPVLVDNIKMALSPKNRKLVVFHPLNSEGYKGTPDIRKAFDILSKRYSDVAEFVIDGKMPYDKYMHLVERTDILVDQKYAITFGMASLDAMASGKILITGNYRSNINDLQYNYIHSAPAFELGTTVEDMVLNIAGVIEKREEFSRLGKEGREFVKTFHDAHIVAEKFLKLYERELAKKQKK